MRLYKPIDGLLGRRRRLGSLQLAIGAGGIALIGAGLFWWLSDHQSSENEVRTDRIVSLSSPDFTHVLVDETLTQTDEDETEEHNEGTRRGRGHLEGEIEPDQTLFVSMRDAGVERESIQDVVDSFVGVFDFRRCLPGDRWEARLNSEGRVLRFRYHVSAEEIFEAVRLPDGSYESGQVEVPTETLIAGFGSVVTSSVYVAVSDAGGSSLANRFVEVFRWDFDFSREAQIGDEFRVITERILLDGEFLRYGQLVAAEYDGHNRQLRAYAFTNDEGQTEFYTDEGEPLRRRFLQTPLTYRRISSEFTHSRYHPVLQRYRPHLGVDYAAETGTPIWAIADGRVTFADERGGNGNLVVIEHDDEYESLYAHLSRFGEGIERGEHVDQGDVIGYVGNTGLSSGPHLHLGVRLDGEYIDFMSIESSRGPALTGQELAEFQRVVERWSRELGAVEIDQVDLTPFLVESQQNDEMLPNDFDVESDTGNYE